MSTRFRIISLPERGAGRERKVEEFMTYLRAGVRIPVELPVQIRWKSRAGKPRQAEGKTAGISGNGMVLTLPVRLPGHTPVTITVSLPVDVTKVPVRLLCRGRVTRARHRALAGERGGLTGIRATIDDYRFQRARRPV